MQWFAFAFLLIAVGASAGERCVTDYGAVGDAKTDCTAAFQKAMDEAAKAGGGIVTVPTGRFRVDGNLAVPAWVTLQGTFRTTPLANRQALDSAQGSTILAYAGRGSAEGKAFITLAGHSATIAGLVIAYPEVKLTDVPPVPYPPCVEGGPSTENVAINDCAFLNPYEAIKLVLSHRHQVRNVQGYPIKRGIYVDQCYDIGRIENIHFWPFGTSYAPSQGLSEWINLNGVAFEFARSDWEAVTNTFCFGYGVGYKFSEDKSGGTNGSFLGIGADSCVRPVLVQQAQFPGLLITNGEFVGKWHSTDSVGVEIQEKTAGKVSLSNCSFWGPIDRCVWMRSGSGQFTATGCHFNNWDVGLEGSPAIQVDAGRAIVQGCTFGDGALHLRVAQKAKSAIVMGNQADEGLSVENHAGKRLQLLGNQVGDSEIPVAALSNYRVRIGTDGDTRYVRKWHGRESAAEWPDGGTKRWSAPGAQVVLPVQKGKAYEIAVDAQVPEYALQPNAGFYLGSEKVIPIVKAGRNALKGSLTAKSDDSITLDLRVKNWLPKEKLPGSNDNRPLGIAVRSVTVRARNTHARLWDANAGETAAQK